MGAVYLATHNDPREAGRAQGPARRVRAQAGPRRAVHAGGEGRVAHPPRERDRHQRLRHDARRASCSSRWSCSRATTSTTRSRARGSPGSCCRGRARRRSSCRSARRCRRRTAHGIVHRDLKPENVYLVDFLGDPDFVKLLDFGIAKLTEVERGRRPQADARPACCSARPSTCRPSRRAASTVDHRVDVYAMGCILFQLITGPRAVRGRQLHGRAVAAPHRAAAGDRAARCSIRSARRARSRR